MGKKIIFGEVAPSRGWLMVKYNGREGKFAWPPVQGTHQECYQAIARDKELVPAEGLDLALLTKGAYTQNTSQWQSVRENFWSGHVRTPNRVLLVPAGTIEGDTSLAGILVERDTEGKGLSTKMDVPDLSSWKQNKEGVYVSNDKVNSAVFVPSTAYGGKPFEKDGVAQAHLTPEGAELYARTAKDAGLALCNRLANRIKEIVSPEQLVSLLHGHHDRLVVAGDWGDSDDDNAFGVRSEIAEGSAPKK